MDPEVTSAESPETRAQWLLSNDLRVELIRQYAQETTSPVLLASRLDRASLSQVAYHTNVLEDQGLVMLVETRPRLGTCEHFYRIQLDSDLAQVDAVKRLISASGNRGAA